jgi:hypothetical protein
MDEAEMFCWLTAIRLWCPPPISAKYSACSRAPATEAVWTLFVIT